MATKKKKKRTKKASFINKIYIIAVILITSAIVFITASSVLPLGDNIPTWNDIYNYVGLNEKIPMPNGFSMHTIDVGQSESTLIITEGKTILIDAGETDKGFDVVTYLKKYDIKKVDILIATHPHTDHIGGMSEVVKQLQIGSILFDTLPNDLIPTTRTYTNLLETIAEKGLKIKKVKAGDSFEIGGSKLEIIAPIGQYSDLNEMALVIKLSYKNIKVLFTGDAGKYSEKDILEHNLDLKCDILKVGHHGSNESSTKAFLQAVNPKYSIISVGVGNSYNLPGKDTILRLNQLNTKIFRTDLNGDIVLTSDGETITIKTSKG